MADAYVGVSEPDTLDKLVDTDSLTVGANTVHRQRFRIAGAGATDLATVDASFGLASDIKRIVPGVGATHLGKASSQGWVTGDVGLGAWGVRNDSLVSLSDTDLDYTPIAVTAAGAVIINDGGGAITIEGAVSQTGSWTMTVNPPTADPAVYFAFRPTDGTNYIAPGTEYQEDGNLAANAGKGTLGIMRRDDALSTLTPVEDDAIGQRSNKLGALWVDPQGGSVAHGDADVGNGVKLSGRADTTFQTAVTDGQRVDALFDVYGHIRVRKDHANKWSFHYDGSSAQTDTSVAAAPGSGLSLYVTDIIISTGAATALNVFFEEGSTKVLGPWYLEATAGRGITIRFETPKKITANTALTVTTSAAIAQAIDVCGFIAP